MTDRAVNDAIEAGVSPDTGGSSSAAKAPARPPLDFDRINAAALANMLALLRRWLPDGRENKKGEFLSRNPKRADRHVGSFSINVRSGKWSDFATGDKGGDPISLAAYLSGLSQYEAAAELANMLGIKSGGSD